MDSLLEYELTLEAPLRVPLERVLVSKPNDESILMQTGPLCERYTVLIVAQRGTVAWRLRLESEHAFFICAPCSQAHWFLPAGVRDAGRSAMLMGS